MDKKILRLNFYGVAIISVAVITVAVSYYFIFFLPKLKIKEIEKREQTIRQQKVLEEETKRQKTAEEEETRRVQIELEIKKVDLENERLKNWEGKSEELDRIRQEEIDKNAKEASLGACMKVVVANYHKRWNYFCEEQGKEAECALSREYSDKLDDEYEEGKKQCETFFK